MDRVYGSVDKALPSKPSLNPQDPHESQAGKVAIL